MQKRSSLSNLNIQDKRKIQNMRKVRWIVQKNLISENDLDQILSACTLLDIPCEGITVIPFSKELPHFSLDKEYENIYYGSTKFIRNLQKNLGNPLGIFFSPEAFSMRNSIQQYGKRMLNSEADIMPLEVLVNKYYVSDMLHFVRPNDDSKSFDGRIMTFGEICNWYDDIIKVGKIEEITPQTEVVLAPVWGIGEEWRCIVVKGKVISATLYRQNFRLVETTIPCDVPWSMINFVEDRCREYTPHDVFVMDVALSSATGDPHYYILECGCANSVGFYNLNILVYVSSLTNYVSFLE